MLKIFKSLLLVALFSLSSQQLFAQYTYYKVTCSSGYSSLTECYERRYKFGNSNVSTKMTTRLIPMSESDFNAFNIEGKNSQDIDFEINKCVTKVEEIDEKEMTSLITEMLRADVKILFLNIKKASFLQDLPDFSCFVHFSHEKLDISRALNMLDIGPWNTLQICFSWDVIP